jgi:hypothetical protein
MDSFDEGSESESKKDETQTMASPTKERETENQQPRHHSHHDQQVQSQLTQSSETQPINDVFLNILKNVATQDRQILLELVDLMKQMSRPEQCSAMLRGFNMGVCVGVKFANSILQQSPSPSRSGSSPEESTGSGSNEYNSSSSSDSPTVKLMNAAANSNMNDGLL